MFAIAHKGKLLAKGGGWTDNLTSARLYPTKIQAEDNKNLLCREWEIVVVDLRMGKEE